MFCIYHRSDFDGKCSAAIVKLAYSGCQLVPYDYGDDIDLEQFKGQGVWMVDCSLEPFERMHTLAAMCQLTWIDHHKSVIEKNAANPVQCQGKVLADGRAGCELTWETVFPQSVMPTAVWLLGRYDVWDLEAHPWTVPFQYGVRASHWDPEDTQAWAKLFTQDGVPLIVEQGKVIQQYERTSNESLCKGAFELDVVGLRCIALNTSSKGSLLFESVWDPEKYQAMAVFCWNGKHWRCSLYSDRDDVDCSAAAARYGGGGHKGAAGFETEEAFFLTQA